MPHDYGHIQTEKMLAELERRIAAVYKEASDELKKKIEEYFVQFEKRDAHQRALLDAGKITKDQYTQWRLNQIGRGKRFEDLRDKVAERYTNANEVAVAYVNDATPGIYSLNRNYAAYTIEQAVGSVGFTLWDEQTVKRLIVEEPGLMPYYPPEKALRRGIDLDYGKKVITKQVTSGILLGESIGKIANRLQNDIPGMERASAVRTARTSVTGAQNAGRMDSYYAAEELGIEIQKEWLATLDSRTRHSHAVIDGERRNIDKAFSNGCMFPGDPQGPAREVYNCRCTLITSDMKARNSRGAQRRARNPDTGENELISDMTYQEWAGWKTSVEKQVSGGIIKPKGIAGALNPESTEAYKHAEQYYDSVRKMTTDVSRIAKNTGYSERDISAVKAFIFEEEHELSPGVFSRFEPSYEMAESWQRLIDGKNIQKHDLTLLAHEITEKRLMDSGYTQEKAHIAATRKYNYAKEAYEYYDKTDGN